MKIYIAQMESESYSWIAAGLTEEESKKALLKEWNKHQKELKEIYERDPFFRAHIYKSVEALERNYDICVYELEPGQAERW